MDLFGLLAYPCHSAVISLFQVQTYPVSCPLDQLTFTKLEAVGQVLLFLGWLREIGPLSNVTQVTGGSLNKAQVFYLLTGL